jgi:nitroreductase
MSGIIFLGTQNLHEVRDFYTRELGMSTWLEQPSCLILQHGNLLLGFCERDEADTQGVITLFYSKRAQVDAIYQRTKGRAEAAPMTNDRYQIYQFFATDPEGRTLEFQTFLHQLPPYMTGEEMFLARRSIRDFTDEKISQEILWKVFELCRYSPTSQDNQAYYYVVVQDPNKQEALATLRSPAAPIARAPAAVAICTDPEKTGRPDQDSCIAAYHFILAARLFGLGTCWIAAMDRDEAKDILGIPRSHYIATITPLGYPAEAPEDKARRPAKALVKFVGE